MWRSGGREGGGKEAGLQLPIKGTIQSENGNNYTEKQPKHLFPRKGRDVFLSGEAKKKKTEFRFEPSLSRLVANMTSPPDNQ